jgi:hypothetical protein
MANDNDYNTDTSTYDTSVTNVSDVDALVMMPVAMIMMLIPRRLQPNHGNCAHSDVDNDPGSGRGGPTQVRPCRRQPARFWPRKSKKTQKNTHKIKIKSKLNQN